MKRLILLLLLPVLLLGQSTQKIKFQDVATDTLRRNHPAGTGNVVVNAPLKVDSGATVNKRLNVDSLLVYGLSSFDSVNAARGIYSLATVEADVGFFHSTAHSWALIGQGYSTVLSSSIIDAEGQLWVGNTNNTLNTLSTLSFSAGSDGHDVAKIVSVNKSFATGATSTGDLSLMTRNIGTYTEGIRITNLARVGIRDSIPDSTFTVNGSIHAKDYALIDKDLRVTGIGYIGGQLTTGDDIYVGGNTLKFTGGFYLNDGLFTVISNDVGEGVSLDPLGNYGQVTVGSVTNNHTSNLVVKGTINGFTLKNGSAVDTVEFGNKYFAKADSNTTKNPITLSYAINNYAPISGSANYVSYTGASNDLQMGAHYISATSFYSYPSAGLGMSMTGNAGGYVFELNGNNATQDQIRLQSSLAGDYTNYVQLIIDPTNGISTAHIGTGNSSFKVDGNITAQKITLDSMAYGSAYIEESTKDDSITISSSSQYYTVGAVQGANGYKITSGGVLKNVTVQDSSITIGVDGIYKVTYSANGRSANIGTGSEVHGHLFINDVLVAKAGADGQISNTGVTGRWVWGGSTTLESLHKNDILKVKLASPDDAGGTIIVRHFNIEADRIE
jgi:hypothetical protein